MQLSHLIKLKCKSHLHTLLINTTHRAPSRPLLGDAGWYYTDFIKNPRQSKLFCLQKYEASTICL